MKLKFVFVLMVQNSTTKRHLNKCITGSNMLEETFVQRVKFAQLPIFYDKNIFKKKKWLGVGLGVRVVVNKIKWRKEKNK